MSYFNQCKIEFLNISGADMPDKEYFALKGYTSISRLKLLLKRLDGSAEKYQQGTFFGYNESLLLGSAVHSQLLQPQDFSLSEYKGKPSGKLGYFIEKVYERRQKGDQIFDAINNASQEADYYKDKFTHVVLRKAVHQGLDYYMHLVHKDLQEVGKEVYVLSPKLLTAAKACIQSVKNNSPIQNLLRQNLFEPKQFYNEIALFSDIKVTLPDNKSTVIKFKGKLDSVIWDPEKKILYLNDVKTTSKSISYFMDNIVDGEIKYGTFSHHAYESQLAVYQILLQKYFQEILHIEDYTLQCNIFAVETTGEYKSDCFRINNSYIDFGILEFKEMICSLAYYNIYGFDKQIPIS